MALISAPLTQFQSGLNLSTPVVSLWHRSEAKVNHLLGNAPPETPRDHESTCRISYEIVEMITAHLTRDLNALKVCSLSCRSWHILVVPHLHHTLTFRENTSDVTHDKLKPLSKLHELGLLPHARDIRVDQPWGLGCWFVPQAFSRRDLRYFSALTNVHTLGLQNMEIYRFIPGIEHHFGHFAPTLRSIVLFNPRCTPRQLSHFLSLFTNMDDIEIRNTYTCTPDVTTSDTDLVLFSAPKLRGRLVLYDFRWVETWVHPIASCGVPQFRHVELSGSAGCIPILSEACAETLEVLRLSTAYDLASEQLCTSLSANLN